MLLALREVAGCDVQAGKWSKLAAAEAAGYLFQRMGNKTMMACNVTRPRIMIL